MTTKDQRPAKSEMARSVFRVLLLAVAGVCLYVAALGPLVSLADRGYFPGQVVRTVYAPLPRSVGLKSLRAWSHFDREHFRDVIWEER